ncbi:DUF1295-domain-containing protein [Lentinula aciculospora]|uniref:DUF1295-domain-containing protein n=1 Tax=Lentinula aciculospora TaxID=153920 RepID=A0A9W9DPN5_9AGAR|nr:DUF1295-domain-containing protein [Lentinula aciculospora]
MIPGINRTSPSIMDSLLPLLSESPFAYPFRLCIFLTATTYVTSVVTSNVSQVDRLWTFLPTIYTAYFALGPLWPKEPLTIAGIWVPFIPFVPAELEAQFPRDATDSMTFSPRALILLSLITLWMFRLSYNTFRRGLFSLNDEDYRWAVLRTQFNERFGSAGGKFIFQIVNLTFIAATQNVLLMGLGYPAYLSVTQTGEGGIGLVDTDYVLSLWALGILAVEFTSDNQQFVYQTYKHAFLGRVKNNSDSQSEAHTHALRAASAVAWPCAFPETDLKLAPADARRGFITSGLWSFSRHPNFACEQTFWWLMCAVPVFAELVSSGRLDTMKETVNGMPDARGLSWEGIITSLSTFMEWLFNAIGISSSTSTARTAYSSLPSFASHELTHFLPAIALSVLFVSSTAFTEAISTSKYPIPYSAYQKRVAMFGSVPILGLFPIVGLVSLPVVVFFGWNGTFEMASRAVKGLLEYASINGVWWRLTTGHVTREKMEVLVWGDSESLEGKDTKHTKLG